ncbi:hypothetical protein LXL04_014024 [Taraxacum kok-saghyz]
MDFGFGIRHGFAGKTTFDQSAMKNKVFDGSSTNQSIDSVYDLGRERYNTALGRNKMEVNLPLKMVHLWRDLHLWKTQESTFLFVKRFIYLMFWKYLQLIINSLYSSNRERERERAVQMRTIIGGGNGGTNLGHLFQFAADQFSDAGALLSMLVQVRTIIKFENGGTNLDRYKSHLEFGSNKKSLLCRKDKKDL